MDFSSSEALKLGDSCWGVIVRSSQVSVLDSVLNLNLAKGGREKSRGPQPSMTAFLWVWGQDYSHRLPPADSESVGQPGASWKPLSWRDSWDPHSSFKIPSFPSCHSRPPQKNPQVNPKSHHTREQNTFQPWILKLWLYKKHFSLLKQEMQETSWFFLRGCKGSHTHK